MYAYSRSECVYEFENKILKCNFKSVYLRGAKIRFYEY